MLLKDRKIAVVEDDLIMGESLVQCLSLEGAQIQWFTTGVSAINGLARQRHDVVLCDICLPDIQGPEVFKRAALTGAPRFIFMTAFGKIEEAVALMKAGLANTSRSRSRSKRSWSGLSGRCQRRRRSSNTQFWAFQPPFATLNV